MENEIKVEPDTNGIGMNRIHVGDTRIQEMFRWSDTGEADSELPCLYYAIEYISTLEQQLEEERERNKGLENKLGMIRWKSSFFIHNDDTKGFASSVIDIIDNNQ